MGNELSKSIPRRLRDPAFLQRYFVGNGLDVGAGGDGLAKYRSLFPLMQSCDEWDLPQGDATTLARLVGNNIFDFVHSSHCLEHLADPVAALTNWLRVVKPGGHIVVLIPEWSMYEHRNWPSTFNSDHKHAFFAGVGDPSPYSIMLPVGNVLALLLGALPVKCAKLIKLEVLESTFLPEQSPGADQTVGIGECAIEFVLRKL